jgi:hypothetical protein
LSLIRRRSLASTIAPNLKRKYRIDVTYRFKW